jgi:hypothetical protein
MPTCTRSSCLPQSPQVLPNVAVSTSGLRGSVLPTSGPRRFPIPRRRRTDASHRGVRPGSRRSRIGRFAPLGTHPWEGRIEPAPDFLLAREFVQAWWLVGSRSSRRGAP